MSLPRVTIEPDEPARGSVIWLHGLGADGHDFEPIVPYLGLDPSLRVRFVFPHAPPRPVTVNAGMIMRAWYDIRQLGSREDEDEHGIRESATLLTGVIEEERERGVPSERIVLAGFSQGGALALHVALRHPAPLAGLLVLSAYLVLEEQVEAERHAANRTLPIFQAHGTLDPMVPVTAGERARDVLLRLGYPVEWRAYPMGHEVRPEEIRHIGTALGRMLGSASPTS